MSLEKFVHLTEYNPYHGAGGRFASKGNAKMTVRQGHGGPSAGRSGKAWASALEKRYGGAERAPARSGRRGAVDSGTARVGRRDRSEPWPGASRRMRQEDLTLDPIAKGANTPKMMHRRMVAVTGLLTNGRKADPEKKAVLRQALADARDVRQYGAIRQPVLRRPVIQRFVGDGQHPGGRAIDARLARRAKVAANIGTDSPRLAQERHVNSADRVKVPQKLGKYTRPMSDGQGTPNTRYQSPRAGARLAQDNRALNRRITSPDGVDRAAMSALAANYYGKSRKAKASGRTEDYYRPMADQLRGQAGGGRVKVPQKLGKYTRPMSRADSFGTPPWQGKGMAPGAGFRSAKQWRQAQIESAGTPRQQQARTERTPAQSAHETARSLYREARGAKVRGDNAWQARFHADQAAARAGSKTAERRRLAALDRSRGGG